MSGIIRPYNNIYPTIDKEALIAETAVITGDVVIERKVGIWYGCIIRGDVNIIRIGEGTNIQDGTVIHVTRPHHSANKTGEGGAPTIIGKGVTVGHQALLHGCIIEDHSFIGMKSVIMDLARVETGAMVAAGAIVTPGKIVKTGEIWAGNPARFFRKISDTELKFIKESETNYIKLAEEYFAQK